MILSSLSGTKTAVPATVPGAGKPHAITQEWKVGVDSYSSTAELLARCQAPNESPMICEYTLEPARPQPTPDQRLFQALHGGVTGAVTGACAGTFMAGAVMLATQALNMLAGSAVTSVELSSLVLPALGGALLCGSSQAWEGYKDDGQAPVHRVVGQLQRKDEQLQFQVFGNDDQLLDLNRSDSSYLLAAYGQQQQNHLLSDWTLPQDTPR